MNELDLAVLKHASTNGFHSVSMLRDANDAITVTVASLTTTTTMRSIIRIERDVASCSFSFSEKAVNNGGKSELTSHIIYCETLTDVIQILDKFRTHLRAAYIDTDALKMHLVSKKDKVEIISGKISGKGVPPDFSDVCVQVVGRTQTPNHTPMPAQPDAPLCGAPQAPTPPAPVRDSETNCPTAKKEDDLTFNTDLDEEDKT